MNYEKIIDDLVELTTKSTDSWGDDIVITCIPVLSCTKLTYQPLVQDRDTKEIKLSHCCKFNLFHRNYPAYEYLWKMFSGNTPIITKKDRDNIDGRVKGCIRKLVSMGMMGKCVVGFRGKVLKLHQADEIKVTWTPEGVIDVWHPDVGVLESDEGILSFLDSD